MDWIKIKTGHLYGTDLTKLEIAALVIIQVMTAHFERIPTESERRREVSDDLLSKLQAKLERSSTTLQEVLDEVLKDCQRVLERRSRDTAKKENWRKKNLNKPLSPVTTTAQRREEERREGSCGDKVTSRFTPPTIIEIKEYCKERQNLVDPERFIDHYTAKGWMIGKSKMKDWKAAVRTWEKESRIKPKEVEPQYQSFKPVKHEQTVNEMPKEVKDMVSKIGNLPDNMPDNPKGIPR